MALPTLDATFASSADLPRKQMLAKWLVEEKGETQAPSSVLVSGAESSAANGTYTYRGEFGGKPYYNLVGASSSIDFSSISWAGINWVIFDAESNVFCESSENVEFPWLVATWLVNVEAPAPTVTEIPQPSPISNYYSLPERYLWAKIAVAAGAPKTEADYISLPKNYAWSDIYNAVSGDIANSTVVVSGLSDTQYNGSYVYDGDVDGRPSYRLNASVSIFWSATEWRLSDENVGNTSSEDDVAYPWLVTNWYLNEIDPTGFVLTPQTPNHTDWSENVALGHIAAAYRGDTANPANLATYIDWPWRYKVASIIDHIIGNYNAVIVSGAGTASSNGTYLKQSGLQNGKPYYIYGNNEIVWSNTSWDIVDNDGLNGEISYQSSDDTLFPWDAVFTTTNGTPPPPTLTPTNV